VFVARWTLTELKKSISDSGSDAVIHSDEISPDGSPVPLGARREKTGAEKTLAKLQRESLAAMFQTRWRQLGGPDLVAECEFTDEAKWRIDFAIPSIKMFIEIDGGEFITGPKGHGYGAGMVSDYRKQNAATIAGWNVFRFSTSMVGGPSWTTYIQPVVDWANAQMQSDL